MKGIKGFQKGNKEGTKKAAKTIQKEKEIEFIQEKIRERLEPIIDALILKCEQNDLPAIKEALDRLIGKSKESMDITSGGEKLYNWNNYKKEKDEGEVVGR